MGSTSAGAETSEALTLGELLPDATTLHPDVVAYAPLSSSRVRELSGRLNEAIVRRDQAEQKRTLAQGERLVLASRLATTTAAKARWQAIEAERSDAVVASYGVLSDLAVGAFVGGERGELDLEALQGETDPIRTLNSAARITLEDEIEAAEAAYDEAHSTLIGLYGQERTIRMTMPVIEARWALADQAKIEAAIDIARITPELEQATVLSQVDGVAFPAVVLDAYYRAALATNARYPACQLSWNQLAGIGKVETVHGTYGGAAVQPDGAVEPHILGIVLDGSRSLAIGDTDGGRMDGNTVWDRAVGPMQFIPGSWRLFSADGNGDGVADPHNLYDAAAAAGNHLCRSHSGLQNLAAFRSSLLGYNRSVEYGSTVMAFAAAYGNAISLHRPPVPDQPELVDVPLEPETEDVVAIAATYSDAPAELPLVPEITSEQ